MRSEIFENYAVIALEQGLISKADSTARVGSDDISTIEALYGVKPNGRDEKSITEQAHPDSVIIAPSYDRLNGLVENDKQRQNIIIQILNKAPQAKLTQHRYAEQALLAELIKIGFFLDNQDQLELVTLADSCTQGLHKQAILPLLGAIAGGLALIGAYNHFAYLSQGVANDCENAIEAVEKFSQQVPEIVTQLSELVEAIRYVKNLHEQTMHHAANFKNIKKDTIVRDAVDLGTSSLGQQSFKLMAKYKRAATILANSIMKVYVPIIKAAEPAEERSSTLWKGIMTGWSALFGSTKNDALSKLVGADIDLIGQGGLVGSLRKSVEQITAKENAMRVYVEQNKGTLTDYLSETDKDVEEVEKATPVVPEKKKLVDELKDIKPSGKGTVI